MPNAPVCSVWLLSRRLLLGEEKKKGEGKKEKKEKKDKHVKLPEKNIKNMAV